MTEGAVAQVRVENVAGLVDDGLCGGLRLRDVGPFGYQPLELDHRPGVADSGHHLLEDLPVHQKVARVAVDGHNGLLSAEQFFLVVRRNVDDAVDFAVEEEFLGLHHVGGLISHVSIRPGVESLGQRAARRSLAQVDDTDGHVAQDLRRVGQRIGRGVDKERENQNQHDAAVRENRAVFVGHDGAQLLTVGFELSCETVHATISPRIFLPCKDVSDAAGTETVRR